MIYLLTRILKQHRHDDGEIIDVVCYSNNKSELEEKIVELSYQRSIKIEKEKARLEERRGLILKYVEENFQAIVDKGQYMATVSQRRTDEDLKDYLSRNPGCVREILKNNDCPMFYDNLWDYVDINDTFTTKDFEIIEVQKCKLKMDTR